LAQLAVEGFGMRLVHGVREAMARLDRLDMADAITDALGIGAPELEVKVIEALSKPPGEDHSAPWLRTGALRESIGHEVNGAVAVIGSSSDVAVDQELGTRAIPPRPFLASTAAAAADDTVTSITTALARRLADQ
jgi:hypothetical protein